MQICVFGGLDAILTTDPKDASEIDAGIDLPYRPDAVISAGNLRLGPHFAPLAKWASRMAVINSVFVGSANHPAAGRQLLRLRTGAADAMPTAADIIGSRRDTQALPAVTVAMPPLTFHGVSTPNAVDASVFTAADEASREELVMLAETMKKQARGLERGATRTNLESCAAFVGRLPDVPRYKKPSWPSVNPTNELFAGFLQRALWLIENDLTRAVFFAEGNWDTHLANLPAQAAQSATLLPLISDFLSDLDARKTRSGATLLDETLVMISSELGRFPVLNLLKGKDHFPEMPVILLGGGVGGAGTTFGRSGRKMEALRVSKKSGMASGDKQGFIGLTDVGTTVLRLFDIDPISCGYEGDTLEFLGVG